MKIIRIVDFDKGMRAIQIGRWTYLVDDIWGSDNYHPKLMHSHMKDNHGYLVDRGGLVCNNHDTPVVCPKKIYKQLRVAAMMLQKS